jgi:tetratricopeptide (TPR) repeat protein
VDPVSQLNLGAYLQNHGNFQAAISHYQTVIRLTSDTALLSLTYTNLGSAYRTLGSDDLARVNYEQALHINPEQVGANVGLGMLFEKETRYDEAIKAYSLAAELAPGADAYARLGRVFELKGERQNAVSAYQEALRIDPGYTPAQHALDIMRSR